MSTVADKLSIIPSAGCHPQTGACSLMTDTSACSYHGAHIHLSVHIGQLCCEISLKAVVVEYAQMAYCIQRAGARRVGALNTVGALAVLASKYEVID